MPRKHMTFKSKRSAEGEPASQPELASPQAVAAFIVRGLVKNDTYRDDNLAQAAALGAQIPFWEAITSLPDLDKEIRAAATAEISELASLTADLRRRAVQNETRSGILFEAAKLPKLVSHIANALLNQLDEASLTTVTFGPLFPNAMAAETAALNRIADELGIEIPQGSPQSKPVTLGRRGR